MTAQTCSNCREVVEPDSLGRCPACGFTIQKRLDEALQDAAGGANDGANDPPANPYLPQPRQAQAPTRQEAARGELVKFQQTLHAMTPRLFFGTALIVINIAIFVFMVVRGVPIMGPNGQQMIDWGANFGPKTLGGEWWRLMSCAFLHFGIIHIGVNMWVLRSVAGLVERLLGNSGFLITYLLSALGGSIASLIWNPAVVSAGASGAVFGMFGAMLGFVLLRRRSLPMEAFKSLTNSGLTFVLFNLAMGFAMPFVDNAGHVGGLVAGFVCGLALSHPVAVDAARSRWWRNSLVLLAGAGCVLLAVQLLPSTSSGALAAVIRFDSTNQEANEELQKMQKKYKDDELTAEQFAIGIERLVLPQLRRGTKKLHGVGKFSPQWRKDLDTLIRYAELRHEVLELQVRILRDPGDVASRTRQEAAAKESKQLEEKISQEAIWNRK